MQRFRGQLLSNSGFPLTQTEIVNSVVQDWNPTFPNISVGTILERRLTDSASAHYGGLQIERRRQGNQIDCDGFIGGGHWTIKKIVAARVDSEWTTTAC